MVSNFIPWFAKYRYFVIFPVAVVEGPIITMISGFLAAQGILYFWTAYFVVILGDLTGDTIYYSIGKFGRLNFIHKYGKYVWLNEQRIKALDQRFQKYSLRSAFVGKATHGLGSVLWATAGMARVPYKKFIIYDVLPTMLKSLLLLSVGFYFGQAIDKINSYLRYFSLGITALVVLVIAFIIRSKLVQHDRLS